MEKKKKIYWGDEDEWPLKWLRYPRGYLLFKLTYSVKGICIKASVCCLRSTEKLCDVIRCIAWSLYRPTLSLTLSWAVGVVVCGLTSGRGGANRSLCFNPWSTFIVYIKHERPKLKHDGDSFILSLFSCPWGRFKSNISTGSYHFISLGISH